jgi:bifunctional DNA-binding transcriptional regulator/antitoxin component of YhaV-PrlF toxin-antitoxin module
MPKTDLKPRIRMDNKHRVTIPTVIRQYVKANPGDTFEAEVYGEDKVLLTLLR